MNSYTYVGDAKLPILFRKKAIKLLAMREVARRYSATYGPDTAGDFREWYTTRSYTP